jgi:16S rRNA (cytidine1402-2'-O)-methyltransferase
MITQGAPIASKLDAGLYLIATPLGAARDITLRALDILASADVLAAEDTRTLRHLMEIHGVAVGRRPLIAYHDHNSDAAMGKIIAAISDGKSVVYASEAGTPLISDPGFHLARAVIANGQMLISAPGPSAVLCALTLSGLPTDRFIFAGFAPAQSAARRSFLQELQSVPATLVLYESPKRLHKLVGDLRDILGENRRAAICRELTKRFEEVSRGSLAELCAQFDGRDVKGEVVVLVDRPAQHLASVETIEAALTTALLQMSVKDAVASVASAFGMPRRDVYQMALDRGQK